MINLKLELFNYKKGLDFETQDDIARVVEAQYNILDFKSEKEVIRDLNLALEPYSYDSGVKSLLENLNTNLENNEVLYNLKDLYKALERKNQGMVYRPALNTLLEIINADDDNDRMSMILTELATQHSWINEVKIFVHNLSTSPTQKVNLLSGGKVAPVYTIVEKTKTGNIALVGGSWFSITEDAIEKTLLENHIEDVNKLQIVRTLQEAVKYCDIEESVAKFRISEDITVGISLETKGETFINENKMESETTLENLFDTPIIPIVKKSFYPLLKTVSENIDKFMDLDICLSVTNFAKPYAESFVFNYGKDLYLYNKDSRVGSTLYKYESVTELINDMKNEMQVDLTAFYEKRLDKETQVRRNLEDKIRAINVNIDNVDSAVDKAKSTISMIGESVELTGTLNKLLTVKQKLGIELKATKTALHDMMEKSSK